MSVLVTQLVLLQFIYMILAFKMAEARKKLGRGEMLKLLLQTSQETPSPHNVPREAIIGSRAEVFAHSSTRPGERMQETNEEVSSYVDL